MQLMPGEFFEMPSAVFQMDLTTDELATYAYLRYRIRRVKVENERRRVQAALNEMCRGVCGPKLKQDGDRSPPCFRVY